MQLAFRAICAALAAVLLQNSSAYAQASVAACKIFLNKPVFTSSTVTQTQANRDTFRLLQCSSSWKNAQDAQSAGISATVPIYNIPVPFTSNWSDTQVQQWKAENCSNEERSSNSKITYYSAVYSVDPISAKAALGCFEALAKADATQNDALACTLQEIYSSYTFAARWRRTAGETGQPPKVISFSTLYTTCVNSTALSVGQSVSEGGIALLCPVTDRAAAFALNTDRGSCTASGTVKLPKLNIPANLSLSEPLFVSGQEVEIAANAKIVTNGYPLSIRADRLSLLGPVKIYSFDKVTADAFQQGKPASSIQIFADDFVGQGLQILNAGQNGGVGHDGAQGAPGNQGNPGQGRTQGQQKICGGIPFVSQVCNLVPTGCQGGEDGGTGTKGAAGYQGLEGLPGGNGGDVTLDLPIDARNYVSVLTNVGIDGQAKDCGGLICGRTGGPGGAGGQGGSGGLGGPGAPGTAYCSGTNAGSAGPPGEVGPPGKKGPDGPNGFFKG